MGAARRSAVDRAVGRARASGYTVGMVCGSLRTEMLLGAIAVLGVAGCSLLNTVEAPCRDGGRCSSATNDLAVDLAGDLVNPTRTGMTYVPGGTYLLGASSVPGTPGYDAVAQANERPVYAVQVAPFFLDQSEVTIAAYRSCRCLSDPATGGLCNWSATPGDREHHPVNCVTYRQAQAYCASIGKRLPTSYEWEVAARGGSATMTGARYPSGETAPLSSADQCWNRRGSRNCDMGICDRGTCPAEQGERTLLGKITPLVGILGLSDNVREWTATPFCPLPSDSACGLTGRTIRGGEFGAAEAIELRAARRQSMDENLNADTVGFRCAADAPGG